MATIVVHNMQARVKRTVNFRQKLGGFTLVPQDMIGALETIGRIKDSLPSTQRGWCNQLGLFVQLKSAGDMSRLQAGGKFRSRIDLWQETPHGDWDVRKYNPGEWEGLVEPTLTLSSWLLKHGGMPDEHAKDLESAVALFKQTGEFALPDCSH